MSPLTRHRKKQAKRQAVATKRTQRSSPQGPETNAEVFTARQHNATQSPLTSLPEELIILILRQLGNSDLTALYTLRRVSSVFFRLTNSVPDILLRRNLGLGSIIPWFDGIWNYEVSRREIKVHFFEDCSNYWCKGHTRTDEWQAWEDEKAGIWAIDKGFRRDTVVFQKRAQARATPLALTRYCSGNNLRRGRVCYRPRLSDSRSFLIIDPDRYEKPYPFSSEEKDGRYMGYFRRNQEMFRDLGGKRFPDEQQEWPQRKGYKYGENMCATCRSSGATYCNHNSFYMCATCQSSGATYCNHRVAWWV